MKISEHHTVGIVGGKGRTGRQFAALFRSLGFSVRVTGAKTKKRNAELIGASDIVIFALSLDHAANVIRTEAKHLKRKDQLILDVSSLKVREVDAMMKGKGEVIGMHPLFGPTTESKGERIILCPTRASSETLRALRALLTKMDLLSIVMTPKAHDDLMATVQVIPHLKSLLMADAMRTLGVDLKHALATCTPTYELEFNVIGRFLDDDPSLYMPILFRNPRTPAVLAALQKSVDAYSVIAKKKNIAAASKRYLRCKSFFASHLKKSRSHSEACIRTLLSLSR